MKHKLMYPLVLVAMVGWVACGRDNNQHGAQQSYETVEEGSAAGVTSTLHGPGEVLPPATSTNADTTTAFTIDPNVVGTAAATLPPATTYTPPPVYPIPQTSASPTPPPPAPRPVTPTSEPEPEPEPEPAPPTDTAPPAETAPPTPPQQEEPEKPEEEDPPPPPPTTTDTRGQ